MVVLLSMAAALLQTPSLFAQQSEERYLWLVTIDGLRLHEVFHGAEELLIDSEAGGVEDESQTRRRYWHEDSRRRREMLLPFFWQVLAKQGQVFGSLDHQCVARVTNNRYFSYPGYQELLCGFPDETIDSNAKLHNKNVNVLEWLARKPRFAGKIAAFTSWDVFPYILNQPRSQLFVNAGWEEFDVARSEPEQRVLNRSIAELPRYWESVRYDMLTFAGARHYLDVESPAILYLSVGETDDWCHAGRYDLYLDSARRSDQYLRELWQYAQQSEKYRGKTSMLVTTDHGRGNGREGWKNHSDELPGSEFVWMAVIGPDTPALGVRDNLELSLSQVAATAAALVGYPQYADESPQIAPPLPGVRKAGVEAD